MVPSRKGSHDPSDVMDYVTSHMEEFKAEVTSRVEELFHQEAVAAKEIGLPIS